MADNVVFLEPGDERAQKIAKAMGSQTASDILQILGEGPRSLTDITERLNIPMNTAKYHIENLLDAGLIAVEKTRYSIKGREVKIYTLTNQLLVVAPRRADARSLFLKYASLFAIVVLGTVLIAAISPLFGAAGMIRGSANTVNMAPGYSLQEETGAVAKATAEGISENITQEPDAVLMATRSMTDTHAANVSPGIVPSPAPVLTQLPPVSAPMETAGGPAASGIDPSLAFFLGGVLVIFILLVYEGWIWKKHYR